MNPVSECITKFKFSLLSSLKLLIQNDILVKNGIHKKREEVHESIDILFTSSFIFKGKNPQVHQQISQHREVKGQKEEASMRTCLKISKGEMLALSFGLFFLKETYLILIFSIHFPSHPSHFDVFYAYSDV